MLSIKTRELTKKERRIIRRDKVSSVVEFLGFMFFMFLTYLFFLCIPFFICSKFYPTVWGFELHYFIIACIVSFVLTSRSQKGFKSSLLQENEQPLNEIKAEVLTIKTTRAIMREDPEDFGIAFYLDISENNVRKTLFLWGQYLYLYELPNTEFILTRRSDTKTILQDIVILGEHFESEKTLPPFSDELFLSDDCPKDGQILNISLDKII